MMTLGMREIRRERPAPTVDMMDPCMQIQKYMCISIYTTMGPAETYDNVFKLKKKSCSQMELQLRDLRLEPTFCLIRSVKSTRGSK